jgi:YVTN family beta-propeller protein
MADLPSGAVTFLFTDIEGSTRLVRQLRDRYPEVLAEHQRLLREAFSRHGGHEIDTQGDAFFYAFPSAHHAVLAAIEGQRALSGYAWPDETEVKVRVGIHTGQAAPVNGRYTGLAVHRAARICSAAHGGQMLVSQATQSLLEDEEEDLALHLRDIGDHRLKDIDRPVRLYQVAAPGLPAEFPPPRGEAEPTEALEATMAQPLWRRRRVVGAAALALLAAVAAAALLATRDTTGGLSGVRPNHVGVIDPKSNEIVAEFAAGLRPGPVAAGGGSVWVGNLEERSITRIDAATREFRGNISLDGRTPTGIAFGAGALWVAHGLSGQLSRVDPQFGNVSPPTTVAGEALGSVNGAVAYGGGAIWAVFGDSTLARIEPSTNEVTATTFVERSAPAAIVVVEPHLWVANTDTADVQRYHTGTFEEGPLGRAIPVGSRPTALAWGEGALWVANTGDDTVSRIDPGTGAAPPIRVGDSPTGVAVGAGAVWVANAGDGTISRIDPARSEVVATIATGNAPAGIAVSDDAVWFSVQAP